MRRVVVTGMGIISCIGNDKATVLDSLKNSKSGIRFSEDYAERGLRSHVYGKANVDVAGLIDRKVRRFMADASAYAYLSMEQAIEDAGLEESDVSNEMTGLIVGTGGGSPQMQYDAVQTFESRGIRRVGPYRVPQVMCSTTSACLATPFKIKGVNYSITSACATSAHCIGNAYELIAMGKQDVIFAGGGEEESWILTIMFDGMGALSTKYNDNPEVSSRAYDSARDGFVIGSGGGMLVLEELEHAKARGAKIYAEVIGYGATSDGYNMVAPSGEGAARCMRQAMRGIDKPIDYINAHGTSTPVGDIAELKAVREVFPDAVPYISSTKSLTGHSLGATSVQEAIYSLLMMENNFIAASANVDNLDEAAKDLNIATKRVDDAKIDTVMSNSFGFGGTNATLIFGRY
ncbi:MAG: beta-ketoacyl-[acyl-carrier-protein] synthase I [Gammaproteobacteria bacterium]|nr:MAG: beta-ketoacyl-[acyl-carrier-protein] synthase I [Gammaproteobacteria bacterium]